MEEQRFESDSDGLNAITRQTWNRIAEWWDDKIGDGNQFQDELIEPATERLLDIEPGTIVLDIACGAGRFTRRMAELGAKVVAIDFCERFIARAKKRTPPVMPNIEYRVLDATDKRALLSLGTERFDGAVATMALMDMASIEPLIDTLPALLKPGGWFIFSILHPCFNSLSATQFAESDSPDSVTTGVKITHYITPKPWKGTGIPGQPELHYYFHRPLSVLFNLGFRHGFVIDGFEEPSLKEQPGVLHLNWASMPEIPPVLVVRMRLASKQG